MVVNLGKGQVAAFLAQQDQRFQPRAARFDILGRIDHGSSSNRFFFSGLFGTGCGGFGGWCWFFLLLRSRHFEVSQS